MSNNVDTTNNDIVVDQAPESRPPMNTSISSATEVSKDDGDTSLSKIGSKTTSTDFGAAHPNIDEAALQQVRLRRALGERTIQMIALAGTIGTGLFLGSGKALATAGPVSILVEGSGNACQRLLRDHEGRLQRHIAAFDAQSRWTAA